MGRLPERGDGGEAFQTGARHYEPERSEPGFIPTARSTDGATMSNQSGRGT
jgi:hypothetical protein